MAAVDAARKYLLGGEVGKALVVLDRAAQETPDLQAVHLVLAAAHFDNGDLEAAADAMERAIEIGPAHVEMYQAAGSYREDAGDRERAIAHWRTAESMAPDDPRFSLQIASVLLLMERYEEALAEAERALEKDETLARGAAVAASALVQLGRHADSLPFVRRAVASEPGFWAYRLIEAQALLGIGEPVEAAATLLALPEPVRGSNAWLATTLADALEATGRPARAARALLLAAEVSGDAGGALRERAGLLLVGAGDVETAERVAASLRFDAPESARRVLDAIQAASTDGGTPEG